MERDTQSSKHAQNETRHPANVQSASNGKTNGKCVAAWNATPGQKGEIAMTGIEGRRTRTDQADWRQLRPDLGFPPIPRQDPHPLLEKQPLPNERCGERECGKRERSQGPARTVRQKTRPNEGTTAPCEDRVRAHRAMDGGPSVKTRKWVGPRMEGLCRGEKKRECVIRPRIH
ncbi:unnamed protein product [Bursaphelenchus xylophilus]|uniref:(pine wood nematode) hypothetical protein n=1 Tax=Bursaphelenchus xylophilus TaxID=6326 RepID=A0A1I7RZ43_BURXY|nr:unnamed protein product [Bursaphelenchus xylophilus]CAG9106874.1 unnamed protein product [Bursaphelenchus xylophilus]